MLIGWIRNCHIFQLLDNWTHILVVRWWSCRLVLHRDLLLRQYPSNAIYKQLSILLHPEIDIQSMKLVHVFFLISRVEGRKVPFWAFQGTAPLSARALN